MIITCDPAKRRRTLVARGLDFYDAAELFADRHLTRADGRRDYEEPRFISVGPLHDRIVVIVWTPRGDARHVISMRKANAREVRYYQEAVAGP